MPSSQKLLVQRATQILRQNGFTAAGLRKGVVSPEQFRFESRLIRVPVGRMTVHPRKHMGW